MLKIIGAILVAFFISMTALSAIALGTVIGLFYTIALGALYALSGYLFGMAMVWLFPASVAAVVAWSGLTLPVPLFFAVINLASYFLQKSVNGVKDKETVTNIFKQHKNAHESLKTK